MKNRIQRIERGGRLAEWACYALLLLAWAVLIVSLATSAAHAARTETRHSALSGSATGHTEYEDTSSANTQLVLATTAKDYSRAIVSVDVVCSSSTSINVTQTLTRTVTSGAETILKVTIVLTATTSGYMLASIPLLPEDIWTVTVPAAGGGITCSAIIVEEKR